MPGLSNDLRRLGQGGTGFGFHEPDVAAVNAAIDIDVFAEVGPIDCIARLGFRLADVSGVDGAVAVGVADEETEVDISGRHSAPVHVGYM